MKKKDRQDRRSRAGFTLIEVMLVVAILGILASIVVIQFGNRGEQARIRATQMSIRNVGSAVQLFYTEFTKLPNDLSELTVDVDHFTAPLDKMPLDSWGNEFQYEKKDRGRFLIRSAGPDEEMGTEDDITN